MKGSIKTLVAGLTFALVWLDSCCANHIITNEENAVEQAYPATFSELMMSHPNLVVFYYTSWCSSCGQIAVEFANTAKYAKLRNLQLPFVKVDCDEDEELVKGFPTIALIINMNSVFYEGEPSSPSILEWLDKKLNNPVTVISNMAAYKRNLENNRAVIIYNGDLDNYDYKVFKQVARLTDESMKFLAISDPNLKKSLLTAWKKHTDTAWNLNKTVIAVMRMYDDREVFYTSPSAILDS